MSSTRLPLLNYSKNGVDQQDDIFDIIHQQIKVQKKPFSCFYNLLSGSAGIKAMEAGIADRYVLNDRCSYFSEFWKHVKNNPKELKKSYQEILSDFNNSEEFYKNLQKSFNTSNEKKETFTVEQAARFAFITNHAKDGKVNFLLNKGQVILKCDLMEEKKQKEEKSFFSESVDALSVLFNKRQVEFSSVNFAEFKNKATSNDMAFLDFPCFDSENLYFHNQDKMAVQASIIDFVNALLKHNTSFMLFYGVMGLSDNNLLPYSHLRMIRVNYSQDHKDYAEAMYVSRNFIRSVFIPKIIRYDLELEKILSVADEKSELPKYQRLANKIKEKIMEDDQWNKPFHQIFEKVAKKYPSEVALISQDERLSYEELNRQVNVIAHYLLKNNIGKGKLVALFVKDMFFFVKAMLAILKTGAAYVPINLQEPHNVIFETLKDALPDVCFYDDATVSDVLLFKLRTVSSMPCINWSEDLKLIADVFENRQNPQTSELVFPEDLAYVMYTSGSTGGKPKGASILHRGLPYCLKAHLDILRIYEDHHVAQLAKVGFDASLMEILLALGVGAKLHIVPPAIRDDNDKFNRFLKDQKITTAIFVPSKLSSLDPENEQLTSLRNVMIVGEKVTQELADKWDRDGRTVLIGYGLTETTICTTLGVHKKGSPVTIGKPIIGTAIQLRKDSTIEEKDESNGEIYVSGMSLADDYRNNLDETRKRFCDIQSIETKEMVRFYRTGDVAKIQDGNFIYQWRSDNQFKIFGKRIDPEQIEYHLVNYCFIKQKSKESKRVEEKEERSTDLDGFKPIKKAYVVCVKKDDISYLSAYLVLNEKINLDQKPSFEAISSVLENNLPSFMIPTAFDWISEENLPLNKNYKVDRKLLAERKTTISLIPDRKSAEKGSVAEGLMATLWQNVLSNSAIDKMNIQSDDDFFKLGGNSIAISRLLREIRSNKNIFHDAEKLTISDIYRFSSLRSMTRLAESNMLRTTDGDSEGHNLYCVHSILGDTKDEEYFQFRNLLRQNITPKPAIHNFFINKTDSQGVTIKELATDYVHRIIIQQPCESNPIVFLLGWSTGGVIAFEMSRQLKKHGYFVYLFIIDTISPSLMTSLKEDKYARMLMELGALLENEFFEREEKESTDEFYKTLSQKKPRDQINLLFDKLNKRTISFISELQIAKQLLIAEHEYGEIIKSESFTESNMPNEVHLFTSKETLKKYNHPKFLGWEPFREDKYAHETQLDGTHFDILLAEEVRQTISTKIAEIQNKKYIKRLINFLKSIYRINIEIKNSFSKNKFAQEYLKVFPVETKEIRETKSGSHVKESKESCDVFSFISQLSSLFGKDHPFRLYIKGYAGSGKTLLIKQFAQNWACTDIQFPFDGIVCLDAKKIVEYFKRKDDLSLHDFICFELFSSIYGNDRLREAIGLLLKERRLFIFVDDADLLKNLYEKKIAASLIDEMLKYPCAAFTGRLNPHFLNPTHVLKLTGLGQQAIQDYVSQFYTDKESAKKALAFINQKNIKNVSAIPMNLQLICGFFLNYDEKHQDVFNITKFYSEVTRDLLFRNWFSGEREKKSSLVIDANQKVVVHCIDRAAFFSLKENDSLVISGKILKESFFSANYFYKPSLDEARKNLTLFPDDQKSIPIKNGFNKVMRAGFLSQKSSLHDQGFYDCEFIQPAFHWYFAADYLKRNFSDFQKEDMRQYVLAPHFKMVWIHLSGFLSEANQVEELSQFFGVLCGDDSDKMDIKKFRLLLGCFEESGYKEFKNRDEILKKMKDFVLDNLDISAELIDDLIGTSFMKRVGLSEIPPKVTESKAKSSLKNSFYS